MQGLEGRGHVVVIDNFFTSGPLLRELLSMRIYATGTVRGNRVGLPLALTKKSRYHWRYGGEPRIS